MLTLTTYTTEQLKFEGEPEIKPASSGFRVSVGKFCVSVSALSPSGTPKTYYLHADGFWRRSLWSLITANGYFETKETAEAALAKALRR